ncbi:hypothetical protein PMIN01_03486 [Paraphaeosphaeria minitans]|uniref:Uncharacterized protein n=1 Tax=Paraphaeosphaeria minitans TaxID=565426 RepID=A0A9P6KSV1_9PLEO|nr:hypothetical protein PMIN01_03486 [Paraphaeosphaeria minitans]
MGLSPCKFHPQPHTGGAQNLLGAANTTTRATPLCRRDSSARPKQDLPFAVLPAESDLIPATRPLTGATPRQHRHHRAPSAEEIDFFVFPVDCHRDAMQPSTLLHANLGKSASVTLAGGRFEASSCSSLVPPTQQAQQAQQTPASFSPATNICTTNDSTAEQTTTTMTTQSKRRPRGTANLQSHALFLARAVTMRPSDCQSPKSSSHPPSNSASVLAFQAPAESSNPPSSLLLPRYQGEARGSGAVTRVRVRIGIYQHWHWHRHCREVDVELGLARETYLAILPSPMVAWMAGRQRYRFYLPVPTYQSLPTSPYLPVPTYQSLPTYYVGSRRCGSHPRI